MLAGQRLTDAGEMLIVARASRSQEQNRREAEERLLRPRAARAGRAEEASRDQAHARLQGAAPETKARAQKNKRLRGRVRFDD